MSPEAVGLTTLPRSSEVSEPRRFLPFGRPMISASERAAVVGVLAGPVLTHGPQVAKFEQAFAAYTGAPFAVATSTCTAALHLAYMHLGIGPGDKVIVPALTHVATAHAVELCGASCIFVDSVRSTGNIDPELIEQRITPRTRAISVVHYLGCPADMTAIMEIARRHDLFVVEDCALALGATHEGSHVGLLGDAGCFSFYPVKHITTGEGGMLITRHSHVAATAARQRAFGIDRSHDERSVPGEYEVCALGNNYRMGEMNAAMGVAQMERLPSFMMQRRKNHAALSEGLAAIAGVSTLESSPDGSCYCHCAVLDERLAPQRPAIIAALKAAGVGSSIYYPQPIPHTKWYRSRHADEAYPVAARMSSSSIALPVGPHLDVGDMAQIAAALEEAIQRTTRS